MIFADQVPAVSFKNVFKSFGDRSVISGLNLTIAQGSFYVLLGQNGAGKTTLLQMLAGLNIPDSGEVIVLGKDVRQDPTSVKRQLAFLPDEPLLYERLTIAEYLEFICGLWSMPANVAENRSRELLEWLDLWIYKDKFISSLSRGMKQKLALAGGLVHDPKLIVLDEPFTGLDVISSRHVKDFLRTAIDKGTTVILTTHIMEVAERLAERIGILNLGRIVAEGTVLELQQQSQNAGDLEDVYLEIVGSNFQ